LPTAQKISVGFPALFLFSVYENLVPVRVVRNEEATRFAPGPASLSIRRCGGPDTKALLLEASALPESAGGTTWLVLATAPFLVLLPNCLERSLSGAVEFV
jgi:hypothetical protein